MGAYDKIRRGLEEAIAHERGEKKADVVRLSVEPVKKWSAEEVKQIRASTGMSQRLFAEVMGVSIKTVEAWEAGRNTPAGPSGRMLGMMKIDPKLPEKMNIVYK